jgi:hypothetical protein
MAMSRRFKKVTRVKLPSMTASLIPVRYCLSGSPLTPGVAMAVGPASSAFSANEIEEADAILCRNPYTTQNSNEN